MTPPLPVMNDNMRLRALQLQQAVQLLTNNRHHTFSLYLPYQFAIFRKTEQPYAPPGPAVPVVHFILRILTNALMGQDTPLEPDYVCLEEGTAIYTQSAFHQQLCRFLHGLTGIAPCIVPHGEGHAVHLD